MTKSVNKVTLIGNVGDMPEIKTTADGKTIANISLATSESWKDRNGQKQERTEWHRLVAFDRLAEIVGQYVQKGSKLYVEGTLRTRSWEQEGQKRYTTEIVLREMVMLDSRASAPQQTIQPQQATATGIAPPPPPPPVDDEIPF